MTKITVYMGQAGTGKTTCLIDRLKVFIGEREWKDYESILAITFMHGSRKRLESKLQFVKHRYHLKYYCSTIDSFSLSMVNKFRSFLNIQKIIIPDFEEGQGYEANDMECILSLNDIQTKFNSLLDYDSVQKYIKNSYPVIIIDEFQDCIGNLFEIVKKLSLSTDLLIATDPFQQLQDIEFLDGIVWIEANNFEKNNLDNGQIWRTNNRKILNSAKALRVGAKNDGEKIKVFACTGSKGVASSFIKKNIYFNLTSQSIAIIAPSETRFVNKALEELSYPIAFQGKNIGPYNHLLSTFRKIDPNEVIASIPNGNKQRKELLELALHKNYIVRKSSEIALRQLSLRNIDTVLQKDFSSIIKKMTYYFNNFILVDQKTKISYTTVHGAKNREFDSVIILWPYQIAGDLLYKRKLLYNAITRAKRNVVVLVQHGNMNHDELKDDELFGLIIN